MAAQLKPETPQQTQDRLARKHRQGASARTPGPYARPQSEKGNPRFPKRFRVLCIKSKEEPPGSPRASGFQSMISWSKEETLGSYVEWASTSHSMRSNIVLLLNSLLPRGVRNTYNARYCLRSLHAHPQAGSIFHIMQRYCMRSLHVHSQAGSILHIMQGVISTCCQIPRHPENSGQIRSTKKQDQIPHFPRKGPLGRQIFSVHSEGIRPQKAFEVLNQLGGDDRRPSPRNPKSPTTPWPFQRRGTHLEVGSPMTSGQKISNPHPPPPPKVPKKIAISIGSLGQAQPTSNPRTNRPRYEASYLENMFPATITPRKSSGSRIRAKLISSSKFGPEKHHSPARRGRRSAGVISTCCQIPRHPENSGQIRSTKKQDQIPHFLRKGPLGRQIFCVHSEGIRPQKAFEVLNQLGGDDRRPSPRNPKSPTTPWPLQRRGTHLEVGSSMTSGQKISKPPPPPPKGPKENSYQYRIPGASSTYEQCKDP
ncbi:hypothetical protein Bca4012_075671 [Brassica carinata]